MIGNALKMIVNELNAYIEQETGHDQLVVLERLVDEEGKFLVTGGKVGCSLVNMEEERIARKGLSAQEGNGVAGRRPPDLLVNLYALFSVNTAPSTETNSNYWQGLELLAWVVRFFQGKPVFTHQNTPQMDPGLEQLSAELYPLSLENQNHLWAGLGAKYIPSALYKLRLVALRDAQRLSLESLVTTVSLEQGGGA